MSICNGPKWQSRKNGSSVTICHLLARRYGVWTRLSRFGRLLSQRIRQSTERRLIGAVLGQRRNPSGARHHPAIDRLYWLLEIRRGDSTRATTTGQDHLQPSMWQLPCNASFCGQRSHSLNNFSESVTRTIVFGHPTPKLCQMLVGHSDRTHRLHWRCMRQSPAAGIDECYQLSSFCDSLGQLIGNGDLDHAASPNEGVIRPRVLYQGATRSQ